jgi:hypothetical protein
MKERSCEDCGYCKEHLYFSYCGCYERQDLVASKSLDYSEAETCEFYDDDSWMK